MDDVWIRCEQAVRLDFLERERDGFLAEGTSYLLEREQFVAGCVFDEVNVREAALIAQRISISGCDSTTDKLEYPYLSQQS